MAVHAGKANPQLDASDLLVVGYQGTLRTREQSPLAVPLSSDPPPALEELLAPWLAHAATELARRTAPALLVFCGQPVPLNGVLMILKDRLLALLIQAGESIAPQQQPDRIRYARLPVLLHLLRTTVAEWISATILFLERFNQDYTRLAAAHRLDQLPPILSISGCASDAHAGGHSVLRLTFAGDACLYYKPRAVTGEWLWHGLLEAIAEQEPALRLPAARMLPGGQRFRYGWMDSLAVADQTGWELSTHPPGSVGKTTVDYWHRAGAMLCLAQHVRLTDLHLANILATPYGPAIVDAECLATPGTSPGQQDPFRDALHSILATGLLSSGAVPGRPNVSGLFGSAGPVEGIQLPQWVLSGQGVQQLVPCSASLADHGNAPAATSPAAVLPQLAAGYRHAAEVLLSARRSLMRTDAPWRRVLQEAHATRIVLRDTLTYAQWISRSLAPRYLRSHPGRSTAVIATVSAEEGSPRSPALLRAESRAILQAQVPRLVLLPGTRILATGSGRPIVHRFARQTADHAVLEAFERLSPQHLENALLPALLTACLNA